jgi:hypothetical protein
VRRVHEELGEPLEDLLDLQGVGLLEVGGCKGDADVTDASGDLFVRLDIVQLVSDVQREYGK